MSWFRRTPREEPPPLDGPVAALIEAEQIEVPAADDVRSRVLQRARATPAMRLRVTPDRFWSRARAAAAAAIVFSLGVAAASAAWRMAERRKSPAVPGATSSAAVPAAAVRREAPGPEEIVEGSADQARGRAVLPGGEDLPLQRRRGHGGRELQQGRDDGPGEREHHPRAGALL